MRPTASLLALMLLLVVPVSCQGCRDGSPGSPVGEAVQETGVSSRPINWEMDMVESTLESNFYEGMEWGPANTRMLQFAGTMDTKNRYASTVMLSLNDDPMDSPDCSGILLTPRLVLTAGSCVCAGQDSGTCQERMFVTAVFYESAIDEFRVDKRFQTIMGRVRPHPEFRRVLDGQGYAVEHRADLAVILLEAPMLGRFPEVHLASTEAQAGEFLTMVGYGDDEVIGTIFGTRYYRKNRISTANEMGGGSFRYEQQGPYLFEAYDGGPCLREDERGAWLVGVASVGSDRQLFCTSIPAYREWLNAELQISRKRSP